MKTTTGGAFTLEGLDAGRKYVLKIAADPEGVYAAVETEPITVNDNVTGQVLTLVAPATKKYTVDITSVEIGGEPVASNNTLKLTDGENEYSGSTDAEGKATFENVPAGTYTLTATVNEKDYTAEVRVNGTWAEEGTVTIESVTLEEAMTITLTSVMLDFDAKTVEVLGKVTNPLEGNCYWLSKSSDSFAGGLELGSVDIDREGNLSSWPQADPNGYVENGETYYLLYVSEGTIKAASDGVTPTVGGGY